MFHKDGVYLFYPKTEEQAEIIQKRLFQMGIYWIGSGEDIFDCTTCVRRGMAVLANFEGQQLKIFIDPKGQYAEDGLPIDVERFCAGYVPEKETIEIGGKKYIKEDVEKALALLQPVENKS